jgi:hypothetical protein
MGIEIFGLLGFAFVTIALAKRRRLLQPRMSSQSGGRWKLPASSLSTRMAEDLASDCESLAKVN